MAVKNEIPASPAEEAALSELLGIAAAGGFLGDDGRLERTREIGLRLDSLGGKPAMLAVYERVANRLPYKSRNLESAWDGIGEWLG